jgi:hypothetical protein
LGGASIGETVFTCAYIEIFFSSTTGREKLKFIWKFSDVLQKQIC